MWEWLIYYNSKRVLIDPLPTTVTISGRLAWLGHHINRCHPPEGAVKHLAPSSCKITAFTTVPEILNRLQSAWAMTWVHVWPK